MSHRVKCYHRRGVFFWAKELPKGSKAYAAIVVHQDDGSRCDTRTLHGHKMVMETVNVATHWFVPKPRTPKAYQRWVNESCGR